MLKSVAHLTWYSKWKRAKLFRNSKSDVFKSFCPQSPASVIPWIQDVLATSRAVTLIYEPPVPNIPNDPFLGPLTLSASTTSCDEEFQNFWTHKNILSLFSFKLIH